jgi:phage terminase large subunit-like protein
MVEGESGILAISPDPERPIYEPSKRRLTWPNGAVATTFSADEPERLRGPQHDAAWCDELGAWRYPEAWDMLMWQPRPHWKWGFVCEPDFRGRGALTRNGGCGR